MSEPIPDIYDDETDLIDLIGALIDSRWLILTITAVSLFLGLVYTLVATPIYEADALIQVEEKKPRLEDLDINALFEGDTSTSAEIEILRSRMVLGTVVDNLKLNISAEPDYFPIFGAAFARNADARPQIRVDSLTVPNELIGKRLQVVQRAVEKYDLLDPEGSRLLSGKVGEPNQTNFMGESLAIFVSELRADEGDVFYVTLQPKLKTIESLQASLSISEKSKGSGIIALSLKGGKPSELSKQVNEIANVYVRQDVERKSAEAQKTLAFLEEQLPAVKQEMEAAEVALNSYRLERGSIDLPLETQTIVETIVAIDSQLNSLQRERDKVLQGFTSAHPMVMALDKQIIRLNGDLSELNDQVRELPNTQQEVLRLVRDTQVNTALYTSLLNTAQELRVVKAGTVSNSRVVDYAITPYKSIKPRKILILLLSLMAGGFIGVLVVFVRRALNGGVDDPEIIEKQLNIPVYAVVAHSKNQDRLDKKIKANDKSGGVLALEHPDDLSLEGLRSLRTALHFAVTGAKNNCVMIAGLSPSVGKSFVSVNLATILASSGKSVLLVDGDMRRGHLHKYLGLPRDNGLSNFISADISIEQCLHQTAIENLTLIPTGTVPPNPSELLLHKRFEELIATLMPQFDYVLVDSAPVLAAADASIIGRVAGTTLMVLESGTHAMREIEFAVGRLRMSDTQIGGFVLNDVAVQGKRAGNRRYSYQYTYGRKA